MDPNNYGLIEMALSFGVVMLFCVWQLVSLERAKKKTREKAEAAAPPEEP
jgi:hypothetical protein